jgi:hypothetical protein
MVVAFLGAGLPAEMAAWGKEQVLASYYSSSPRKISGI